MKKSVQLIAAAVAVMPWMALAQSELNMTPSRVVGQPSVAFRSSNPNVVDRHSLYGPFAVAVDTTSTPNALYVADTLNNRVLGWRNGQQFANGAPADLILGQVDDQSTLPLGPNTARNLGFSSPGAMAVDSKGNLYIVDAGNNRILRFPKPSASQDEIQSPDMVIGQPSFSANSANNAGISERSVSLSSANTTNTAGLAVDKDGNLWFSDALNNRVLRYPKAVLDAGTNGPAADLVLGEPDFRTNNAPGGNTGPTQRLTKNVLQAPSGIAVDNDNRVYVADGYSRVVVFSPPFSNGMNAARLVGIWIQPPNTPFTTPEYVLSNPEGVTIYNNALVVADTQSNRVVQYDPFAQWPAETPEIPCPPAKQVLGQPDLSQARANRGLAEPNESSINSPFAVAAAGTELYVADTGNNRVLVFGGVSPTAAATRLLGQNAYNYNAPNVVEGRELWVFAGVNSIGTADGGGVAIDRRSNPPRLYVADTFNNRVLGYKDARKVRPNDPADIVIGQNDLTRTLVNAPQNNAEVPTDSGLFRPAGLAVDANGDLYIADSGNGRVLRFASPFQQTIPAGDRPHANLVLGQRNFTTKITDPSSRNMFAPFGIALTVEGHLVVSDTVHSRLLFFRRPSGGDYTSGQAAEKVIGQPDFFTVGRGSGANRFNSPHHIALDTDDRLYVTDSGNNRVLLYDRITVAANDPPAAFTIPALNLPQGIWVSPGTGEIWIANTRANLLVRYPRFELLTLGIRSDYQIPSGAPLALTQDVAGNLFAVEGVNRVAMYFNGLRTQVAGNYADIPLSPGAVGIVYPRGTNVSFTSETKSFDTVPLPTSISDIQVMLNERPLPMYFISPTQINFLLPFDAPTSGVAELQVVRAGEILTAGPVAMTFVSPALFVQGANEQGQVAAVNQDGTINSASDPIARGQIISLYATGLGMVQSPPPAGAPPANPVNGTESIRVLVNSAFVNDSDIQYFGLAPGLVGVYQINVRIPTETVPPGSAIDVVVQARSALTNRGFNGKILKTTIAVKQ